MIIYKITFPNKKIYIGQTVQPLRKRYNGHVNNAKNKKDITKFSNGSLIGKAIRKYGLNFDWFEILEECNDIQDLNIKESFWINKYNSNNKKIGYNLNSGGQNCYLSEETKYKISKSSIDKWNNPKIALKMKNGLRKGTKIYVDKIKGTYKIDRINITCLNCGKIFKARPKENRKVCSSQCAAVIGSKNATKKIHESYIKTHKNTKKLVYEWVMNNRNIVEKCPLNKINTNLSPLLELTEINDWRTLTRAVCNTESRKEFLLYLKKLVKMYAEPSDE